MIPCFSFVSFVMKEVALDSMEVTRMGDEVAEQSRMVGELAADEVGGRCSASSRLASATHGVQDKAHGKSAFPLR